MENKDELTDVNVDEDNLRLSIHELVEKYSNPGKNSKYNDALVNLVDSCLTIAGSSPSTISENQILQIAKLAKCPDLRPRIVSCLSSAIDKKGVPSYQENLIKGLILANQADDHKSQSDLLAELKIIVEVLKNIHDTDPDTSHSSSLLSTIGILLDMLVNSNVIEIDDVLSIDDLFDDKKLTDHADKDVAYLSSYCLEAYHRIPLKKEKGKFKTRLDASLSIINNLGTAAGLIAATVLSAGALTGITLTGVPNSLKSIYDSSMVLYETFREYNINTWYEKVLLFQVLLEIMEKHDFSHLDSRGINFNLDPQKFKSETDINYVMGILTCLNQLGTERLALVSDPLMLKVIIAILDLSRKTHHPWITGKSLLLMLKLSSQPIITTKLESLKQEVETKLGPINLEDSALLKRTDIYLIDILVKGKFDEEQIQFFINAFKETKDDQVRRCIIETLLFIAKYGTRQALTVRNIIAKLQGHYKDKGSFSSKGRDMISQIVSINVSHSSEEERDINGVKFVKTACVKLSFEDRELIYPTINKAIMRFITDEFVIKESRLYIAASGAKLDDNYERVGRLTKSFDMLQSGKIPEKPLKDQDEKDSQKPLVLEFLDSRKKVLLLLANGGMGKTTLCKSLVLQIGRDLYREYIVKKEPIPEDIIVPIYISLRTVTDRNELLGRLIQSTLKGLGLTDELISVLKTRQRFLFLLDGYDEMEDTKQNLYTVNHLENWKNSQCIISCRIETLQNDNKYWENFVPYPVTRTLDNKKQYEEIIIAPFNANKIDEYIRKWLVNYINTPEEDREDKRGGQWLVFEEYKFYIEKISGLKELVKTPLFLYIAMVVLPQIVEDSRKAMEEKKAKGDKNQKYEEEFTRQNETSILRKYTEYWFKYQKQKLREGGRIPSGKNLDDECWIFVKELATLMTDRPAPIYIVVWPHKDKAGKGISDGERKKIEAEDRIWEKFFSEVPVKALDESKEDREFMIVVRKTCPLTQPAPYHHAFLHAKIQEFCHAEDVFSEEFEDDNEEAKREVESYMRGR